VNQPNRARRRKCGTSYDNVLKIDDNAGDALHLLTVDHDVTVTVA
jgi:hypothetical protein